MMNPVVSQEEGMVKHFPLWFAGVVLLSSLLLVACSPATHAVINKDDMAKVFPWPRGAEKVKVRVMPKTTSANIYSGLGSWKEVELGPDTTFFITDDLGKEFAYTPSRSPLRRLAPVQTIQIRWPPKTSKAPDMGAGTDTSQPDASAPAPNQQPAGASSPPR
jgi:hypothetical protein